METRAWSC